MFEHHRRITVEWGDCDPAGIVFFPNYLKWFDDCASALFAAAGLPLQTLFASHGVVGIPVVDVRVTYKASAVFGDELLAKTSVIEWRRSSFVIQHRIYKQDVLTVEGLVTRVWVGADIGKEGRLKSRPLPREVVEHLTSYRNSASSDNDPGNR
jgi:4-hydroxybenzoyl-CoA thioesterase